MIKLMLVGDDGVGKTSFCYTFAENTFPVDKPVFPGYDILVNNVWVNLWDTAGGDEFSQCRCRSYPETDVFLVLYSLICRVSLERVRTKWIPEIKLHCPYYSLFGLVGCKLDLRNDLATVERLKERNETVITHEEGQAMADELGAVLFIECSSLHSTNIDETMESVVKCLGPKGKKSNKCELM